MNNNELSKALYHFRRMYYARVPIGQLNIPAILPELKEVDAQTLFIRDTFNWSTNLKYPPRLDYQRRVLKTLVLQLEEAHLEVGDELYNLISRFMVDDQHEKAVYRIFHNEEDRPLVIGENVEQLSQGTTGLSAWQASFALAEWALQNDQYFTPGRHILELGAGVGMTGLSIVRAFPDIATYTFTDVNEQVLERIQSNVNINVDGAIDGTRIYVEHLDWCDFDPYRLPTKPDVLLGSDLCYEPKCISALVSVISYFVKRKKSQCFIASTIRVPETQELFLRELDSHGLKVDLEWSDESAELTEKIFPFVPTVNCECLIQKIVPL